MPVTVQLTEAGVVAVPSLVENTTDAGKFVEPLRKIVMIAPPNTLRTDDQVVGYFRNAAEAVGPDVPFVLQDYPLTSSVQMTPGVIRRIVSENPSCVMLKHEDWPGLEKISTLRGFEAEAEIRVIGDGGAIETVDLDRLHQRAVDGHALSQRVELVLRHAAQRAHAIDPPPRGRRQFQRAGQRAVVGQQEKPSCLSIEPAHME